LPGMECDGSRASVGDWECRDCAAMDGNGPDRGVVGVIEVDFVARAAAVAAAVVDDDVVAVAMEEVEVAVAEADAAATLAARGLPAPSDLEDCCCCCCWWCCCDDAETCARFLAGVGGDERNSDDDDDVVDDDDEVCSRDGVVVGSDGANTGQGLSLPAVAST
jgi:hypothetical protein